MKTRDELMIDEAIGRAEATCPVGHDIYPHIARHTLDLERMNWQPPTDPDLIEVREMVAKIYPEFRSSIQQGQWDITTLVTTSLDCIKRGRELERNGK